MSDSNVLAAQKYLNAMFKTSSYWVHLDENGKTGTKTMQGIIRAFQIHNNVPNPTGNLGPNTISKMKSLTPITKMDPNSQPSVNVCLIQCALFCKGYAAGGITGIYYNNGVNAVKAMQADAGLPVTGIIDWKVWAGLLSLNWFILAPSGDSKLRQIQQQLNSDYSDIIGVCPCDGIKSRVTALSLLVALQAAEGVETEYISDLSAQAFGPATTNYFKNNIGILKNGRNSTDIIPYNKIAQYALYLYGFNQEVFDGIFDSTMKNNVEEFQRKHMLVNIGLEEGVGEIGVSTMKSLLTSKGDIDRKAIACDTSTCLNVQQITDLKNAGYQVIGRYLTGTTGWGETYRSKALTLGEVELLKNAGLKVFPIYQDGANKLSYFQRYHQGYYDAITAIEAAEKLGFCTGTYIYFAVDFDCMEYEATESIIPYFQQISEVFATTGNNPKNYKVGIYAPRLICTMVENAGYAVCSFVADMSTGYSGNLGYSLPENCAFDQFSEITFTSTPSFAIDKLGYSGYDPGCNHFDIVEEETEAENIQAARLDFRRKFLKSNNSLKNNVGFTLTSKLTDKIYLGKYYYGNNWIELSFEYGTNLDTSDSNATLINISFDEHGHLSSEFLNTLTLNISEIEDGIIKNSVDKMVQNMAVSAGYGVISIDVQFNPLNPSSYTVKYTLYTDDVLPELDTKASFYCSLSITFNITHNYDDDIPFDGFSPVFVEETERYKRNSLGFVGVHSYSMIAEGIKLMEAVNVTLVAAIFYVIIKFVNKYIPIIN